MASTNSDEQTVLVALKAALENLQTLTKSSIAEVSSYSRPPPACDLVLQGVAVLLEPKAKKFEWIDAKQMMKNGTTPFIERLCTFDKDSIDNDQLVRLTAILSHKECQAEHIAAISLACHSIYLWLRAMVDYTNLRRQLASQKTS